MPDEKRKKIEIRMTIKDKLAERFNDIMEYHQVKNHTDMIRFLITKEAERIKPLSQ